jgi:hypothetical protein
MQDQADVAIPHATSQLYEKERRNFDGIGPFPDRFQ